MKTRLPFHCMCLRKHQEIGALHGDAAGHHQRHRLERRKKVQQDGAGDGGKRKTREAGDQRAGKGRDAEDDNGNKFGNKSVMKMFLKNGARATNTGERWSRGSEDTGVSRRELYRRQFRRRFDGAVDDRSARNVKDAKADDADGDQRSRSGLLWNGRSQVVCVIARRHLALAFRLFENAALCVRGA